MATLLVEIVIEIDKRIAKMRELHKNNPSQLREGIILGYQDIREYVQQTRKQRGELR